MTLPSAKRRHERRMPSTAPEDHRAACLGHARVRAKRVHGEGLNRDELLMFADVIEKRRVKARFVHRQNNNRTIWDVRHRGLWWRVLYDARLRCVVTVFPPRSREAPW